VQQAFNLQRQSRLFFHQVFVSRIRHGYSLRLDETVDACASMRLGFGRVWTNTLSRYSFEPIKLWLFFNALSLHMFVHWGD
jgi:hypothetical protein